MSLAPVIGVLVPSHGDAPLLPPEARPIGRAALLIQREGIDVVFGDTVFDGRISGFKAKRGGWTAVESCPLVAVHDRFPSQLRSARFNEIKQGLGQIPMGNSLNFTMLCRDKLRTQSELVRLGIRMPEVCNTPSLFESKLSSWGCAFIKPRFGALGIGVQRVKPGDALPRQSPGVVPNRPEPSILQKAVLPPKNWASRTVRVLIQRQQNGRWIQGTPVVRQSRFDPVANAARGAEVAVGSDVLTVDCLHKINGLIANLGHAIDQLDGSRWALEAGADLVLDENHTPWLIELNSRPRGRMEVLSEQDPTSYNDAHIQACSRPIRRIAQLIKEES